ncbi:MAG: biopolymer transporter ExbD [Dysgonamonadaceae bacterium]|jgi:biopolymer transport protein ExbD|nr:biopolymer transporter ExbD [Dysgonamonadaceae bacterium]
MPKVKVKRKSTFIDMTAMCDVTVLLLTFFMLTSTFIKKEPVQVSTPSSVSERKIPDVNILSVLIDPDGRIFMSMDRQEDIRNVLKKVGEDYKVDFTPEELKKFSLLPSFGLPVSATQKFLTLQQEQMDAVLTAEGGIPRDSTDNQFKHWITHARAVNPDFRIAIKADKSTPYEHIRGVMNDLRDLRENKYNLITSLKAGTSADAALGLDKSH